MRTFGVPTFVDSERNPVRIEPGTIHEASPNTSAATASRRNAAAGPIE